MNKAKDVKTEWKLLIIAELRELAEQVEEAYRQLEACIKERDEEIARLNAQLITSAQLKNSAPPVGLLNDMRELAEAQDMKVPEWVFEQLRIVIDEKAGIVGMIPVEAKVYEKFRSIAKGRGVSLEYVTARAGFTDFILDGFDNYRL